MYVAFGTPQNHLATMKLHLFAVTRSLVVKFDATSPLSAGFDSQRVGTSNATYMVSLPYPSQDMYVAFDMDQNHLATMKLHHREEQHNDARDKCRMYIKNKSAFVSVITR